MIIHRCVQSGEKLEPPTPASPAAAELAFSLQVSESKQASFHGQFSAMLFCIFALSVVISLFKAAPKRGAEVLASVPKCKQAAMPPRGKQVCRSSSSCLSHSAIGQGFSVESAAY